MNKRQGILNRDTTISIQEKKVKMSSAKCIDCRSGNDVISDYSGRIAGIIRDYIISTTTKHKQMLTHYGRDKIADIFQMVF